MPQLINPDDFQTAVITITLKNLDTQTLIDSKIKTVKGIQMGHSSDLNQVQMLEILPNGMVLSVPKYTCTTGHDLELDLSVTHMSTEPFRAKILCKVIEFEKIALDQDRIRIELKALSNVEWNKFCELYSKRQQAIQEFFKNVKG